MSAGDLAYVGLPEVLLRLRTILEESGLRCSPYIIDHSGNTASHLVNETFSLAATQQNTGIYRDVTPLRVQHTVTATIVWKMKPSDQFAEQIRVLAAVENLIRVVHLQSRTIEIRVTWQSTTPTLSPTREFLITPIAFAVEHDWYGEPLE